MDMEKVLFFLAVVDQERKGSNNNGGREYCSRLKKMKSLFPLVLLAAAATELRSWSKIAQRVIKNIARHLRRL